MYKFNKTIKKTLAYIITAGAVLGLTACGSSTASSDNNSTLKTVAQSQFNGGSSNNSSSNDSNSSPNINNPDNNSGKNHILIAYFSYFDNTESDKINSKTYADSLCSASVTMVNGKRKGNNDIIAEYLKQQTGADVFTILTEQQYSPDYDNGVVEQARTDGKNKVKPALASHITDISQYDTIIVLYPIWWYDMPMAMYTFFDEYDFSGKTIAPVVTSGGSGLVDTVKTIKQLEPGAKVTDGLSIMQDKVADSGSDIQTWLTKNGIK